MRDEGEPISRGQLDRRQADSRAGWRAVLGAAFFAAVVLVNGILAITLIELFQAVGWWEIAVADIGRMHPRRITMDAIHA